MVEPNLVSDANKSLRELRVAILRDRIITADRVLLLLNSMISITNLDGLSEDDKAADADAVEAVASMNSADAASIALPPKRATISTPGGCTHSNISVFNVCRLCGRDFNTDPVEEKQAAGKEASDKADNWYGQ